MAQRGVGLVYGLAQILVVKFYQYVVEPAKHNSWPVRFFANLACGPFRQPLLEFYATSGDFSRRLTDIRANSKFSSPFATPDDYFSVRCPAPSLPSTSKNLISFDLILSHPLRLLWLPFGG